MKMLTFIVLLVGIGYAQQAPQWLDSLQRYPKARATYLHADPVAELQKQMKLVPGGTFTMGEAVMSIEERRVSVSSFHLQATEVTNRQYRTYLWHLAQDSGMVAFWAAYPDTNCWNKDFPHTFNDPLVAYYLDHPAFHDHPVVGISHTQALAYTQWLNARYQKQMAEKLGPDWTTKATLGHVRLPSEAEWEYAALGGQVDGIYPWPARGMDAAHALLSARDGKFVFRANFRPFRGNFIADNYEYTCAVTTFPPNGYGLYGMAGNAAEWCADVYRSMGEPEEVYDNTCDYDIPLYKNATTAEPGTELRVIRGGSWVDYPQHITVCFRQRSYETAVHSYVGLRLAGTLLGKP